MARILPERGVGMNNRYEICSVCSCETGKAGIGEDSIYCDVCECGPFCDECWIQHNKLDSHTLQLRLTSAEDALKIVAGHYDSIVDHDECPEYYKMAAKFLGEISNAHFERWKEGE